MRIIILLVFCLPYILPGQEIYLDLVANGFDKPVDIVHAGDDRLFIVEKDGIIKIINPDGSVAEDVFLDIDAKVNSGAGERGLLSLVFDPEYQVNGRFFVNYTDLEGNTQVERYLVDSNNPDVADSQSGQIILSIEQPFNNHNGGDMEFGPDGYLYIAMGDGGGIGDPLHLGQDRLSMLGKILRIDVSGESYSIPSDNPFANDDFTLDEIWSLGWRNPWRFSFDSETGDMYIADVGQNKWEEVNVEFSGLGGRNYGWRCFEGDEVFANDDCPAENTLTFPVFSYRNNEFQDGCSITGGFVYRGDSIPYLQGKYIYADYCSGKLWSLQRDPCDAWQNQLIYQGALQEYSSFGVGYDGELYLASISEGTIEKIQSDCFILVPEVSIKNNSCPGLLDSEVSITAEENYSILWEDGSESFDRVGLDGGVNNFTLSNADGCTYHGCAFVWYDDDLDFCDIQYSEVNTCEEVLFFLDIGFCELPDDYQFVWYKDGVQYSGPSPSSEIQITEAGLYSISYANGTCESIPRDVINIIQNFTIPPELNIEGDSIYIIDDVFVSYEWYVDNELLVGEEGAFIIWENAFTTITVIATDEEGCSASSTLFFENSNNIGQLIKWDLYPNPSSKLIHVDFELHKEENVQLQLLNIEGRIMDSSSISASSGSIIFDVSTLPPGTYFIQLHGDRLIKSEKVVKHD